METITFYSYKGGVGRTLTLANIAMYLSRLGLNVCLLDFDLEAPGLHYKFTQYLKTDDIKAGLVDYIYEFTHNDIIPESFIPFSKEIIPKTRSQGEIRLIPAGNVLSAEYWKKLASINWHKLFYEEGSEGVPFFLELKERIEKEFRPDFLLIDSRTGITEMSGVCTVLLPDKIVFLIVNNQENIEGARQIFRSIKKAERLPEQKPIEFVFALTRIPFDKNETIKNQIVNNVLNILNKGIDNSEKKLTVEDICILYSDRELELSESLRLEKDKVSKNATLTRDYLNLFSKIIPDEIMSPKITEIMDEITKGTNPDKAKKELEDFVTIYPPRPEILKKIIYFYIRHNDRREFLKTVHELWESFGIEYPVILSKYASYFMESNILPWLDSEFKSEIIEKVLLSDCYQFKIELEKKLADWLSYPSINMIDSALKHYINVLEQIEDKKEVLNIIINIYKSNKLYIEAMNLCDLYPDIINKDLDLRARRIELAFMVENFALLRKFGEDTEAMKEIFLNDPSIYFKIMVILNSEYNAEKDLTTMVHTDIIWKRAKTNKDLFEIGKFFQTIGQWNKFKSIVATHPIGKIIVESFKST